MTRGSYLLGLDVGTQSVRAALIDASGLTCAFGVAELHTHLVGPREEADVKVRQPLGRMVCVVPQGASATLREMVPLLATELNVKQVEFAETGDALVRLEAKPNFRSLGKRFGKATPLAAQAAIRFGHTSVSMMTPMRGLKCSRKLRPAQGRS